MSEIKTYHERIKVNLSILAKLRDEGVISNEVYQQHGRHIDSELGTIRDLNIKLKEKGISFNMK